MVSLPSATWHCAERVSRRVRARAVEPHGALLPLGPIAALRAGRLVRRLLQLLLGLVLYGVSMALLIRAALGVMLQH